MLRTFSLLICVWVACSIGCAHTQLSRNVHRQSNTLVDIYEQQVLDNLAKFVASPGSIPTFAVPSSGGTTVNHSNTASGGLIWNPTTLTGANASLNGTRTLAENWVLSPVNDPKRLSLMKCAYQHAIGYQPTDCERDCYKDLEAFFESNAFSCDIPQCFYRVCDKKPKSNNCCVKSGSHCGVHVVVDENQFECLSRLTLAILEIATLPDDDFDARFSTEKTVDVTESFIANYGGKLVLVTGSRTISQDDYNKAIESKTIDVPAAIKAFSGAGEEKSMQEMIQGSLESAISDGIDPKTIETVPRAFPSMLRSRSNERASGIESLLQINQAIGSSNQ